MSKSLGGPLAGCTETGRGPLRTPTTLRHLLRQPDMVVAPGAYDCLTATRIEGEGFPAAYMTGGGTAVTRVGTPDLGFTTLTERLASASAITSTISVPLIADADTGYGGPFNAYRTVQEYEKAGVAVLHIEDQAFPTRCGHFDGKAVIPVVDMVAKIHAACDARRDDDFVLIVRPDALAVTGLDDTLRRCVASAQAGADVLCVEALRHQDDIDRVRRELRALGCKIIIFPGSLMLSVCTLAQRVWREIREHGTTTNLLGDMVGVQDFFASTVLQELLALDARWEG